jgi:nucleoside-diphosphate-sugar epimerase
MILLTGATGTAGSFIANDFVRQRVPVRSLGAE